MNLFFINRKFNLILKCSNYYLSILIEFLFNLLWSSWESNVSNKNCSFFCFFSFFFCHLILKERISFSSFFLYSIVKYIVCNCHLIEMKNLTPSLFKVSYTITGSAKTVFSLANKFATSEANEGDWLLVYFLLWFLVFYCNN